ncbi:MAG: substrate-binding domain-containing protein [Proteobacteria bacterium]|nr:substrate-binding domain-containing protein [Pseudomonadota bacterium]
MLKQTILLALALCIVLALPLSNTATGKTLRFAIIPKAENNTFYLPAKQGCMDAAKELGDVQCIYEGPETADPRLQDSIISRLIDEGIDGLAVAVIHSEFIENRSIAKARNAGIPVVTFDSDFSQQTLARSKDIRSTYIGTDNYEFGQKLGTLVLKYRPDGGTLCIISGHKSAPGLNDRMRGVRKALAASASGKWKEYERCPLFCRDDPNMALEQLLYIFDTGTQDKNKVDTIIILGAWPQQNPDDYRTSMTNRLATLESKQVLVIVGDSLDSQLQLLKQGLAHGNVGQVPYDMGKKAVETLYKIHHGEFVPDVVYTPSRICFPENTSGITIND